MKYLIVLTLILLACVAAKNDRTNNYQWGAMRPGDDLISTKIVSKPGKTLRVVEQDFVFPPPGVPKNRLITEIRVKDLNKNAYASLQGGQIESRSVTIHLKSKRGTGFRFLIEIYGR